jgi:hypothetical protein
MGTVPETPFRLFARPGWRLSVYAIDGRQVFDSEDGVWTGTERSGRPLRPGVYFYKLTSGGEQPKTGKLVICR